LASLIVTSAWWRSMTADEPIGIAHMPVPPLDLGYELVLLPRRPVRRSDSAQDRRRPGPDRGVYAQADARGCERTYWMTQEFNTTARSLYDRVATKAPFVQYRR
jgi:hypothetical protein